MRSRKPKSQILRHFDSDEEANTNEIKKQPQIAKLKKNKIKVKISNEKDDDDLETANMKVKEKKKRSGLSIPLFNELHDEGQSGGSKRTFEDLRNAAKAQKKEPSPISTQQIQEKNPKIIAVLPDNHDIDHYEAVTSKDIFQKSEEYISIDDDSPMKDQSDEDDVDDKGFVQDFTMIDDGRLPLTENESTMQRKLHEMGIEEAIYEAELSNDEEMNDWQESRVKQGALNDNSIKKSINLPKYNLLPEQSFHSSLSAFQSALRVQTEQRTTLQSQLEVTISRKKYLQHKEDDIRSNYNSQL